jgi:hypothetical protein
MADRQQALGARRVGRRQRAVDRQAFDPQVVGAVRGQHDAAAGVPEDRRSGRAADARIRPQGEGASQEAAGRQRQRLAAGSRLVDQALEGIGLVLVAVGTQLGPIGRRRKRAAGGEPLGMARAGGRGETEHGGGDRMAAVERHGAGPLAVGLGGSRSRATGPAAIRA